MKLFLINLARRRDRLADMSAQLTQLGLTFETITAIDATTASEAWIAKHFTAKGPLGILPKGDQCCSLSHRKAWGAFAASGEAYAAFLEDDVVLDRAAARLLATPDWLPDQIDVMKLEHFGPNHQRVLVGKRSDIGGGRFVAPILSRHTGAAAYILSRRAALQLLDEPRFTVPVDHLLFNPNVSEMAERLRPYQLLPAIARQADGGASDIKAYRIADRRLRLELIRREIIRAYYELRLLPRQIAQVIAGHAKLMRVAGLPRPALPIVLEQSAAASHQLWSSARLENRV